MPEAPRQLANVHLEQADTTTHVVVSGELDIATNGLLAAAVSRAISAGPETLVVDLQQVDFMESGSVRLLMQAASEADAAAVRLVLVEPRGSARRVLELCGLSATSALSQPPSGARAIEQEAAARDGKDRKSSRRGPATFMRVRHSRMRMA